MEKVFFSIDLKSFYASVECQQLGLDPMTTNLVVADNRKTNKCICLAVTPSLKEVGVKGRPRLFEVEERVDLVNLERRKNNGNRPFRGKSTNKIDLESKGDLELDYIIALPQMAKYIEFSTRIYKVYLNWFSKEDIHVYSIDEVFIDATNYIHSYKMEPKDLAERVVLDVVEQTGITATVGIGSNLYLAKVAMDIKAKRARANEHGVRVGYLDEDLYKKEMWTHVPLSDFWRVGRGYVERLEKIGIHTMGDIARLSLKNEDLLFDIFGINAELLIDHAWGVEPCQIKDIKGYEPRSHSLGSGQVLTQPYTYKDGRIVIFEMAESLSLDLVRKGYLSNHISLTISYDKENLSGGSRWEIYKGETKVDSYGRRVPKSTRGSMALDDYTSSTKELVYRVLSLYDRVCQRDLLIRKISISYNNLLEEEDYQKTTKQLSLFSSLDIKKRKGEEERSIQNTILKIKDKYGKNSILRGTNFEDMATGRRRNNQIGGHQS